MIQAFIPIVCALREDFDRKIARATLHRRASYGQWRNGRRRDLKSAGKPRVGSILPTAMAGYS